MTIKADALEGGDVRPLFGPVAFYRNTIRYDVSTDGQRFLVALPPPLEASTAVVTVVQNWQTALQK